MKIEVRVTGYEFRVKEFNMNFTNFSRTKDAEDIPRAKSAEDMALMKRVNIKYSIE